MILGPWPRRIRRVPSPQLPEPLTGKTVKLRPDVSAGAPATLVMFLCVHCPFVVHLTGALGITRIGVHG